MSHEAIRRFPCFGGSCAVLVTSTGGPQDARAAVTQARARMLGWHDRFSRFAPDSELSQLNADPRPTVPVSALMARLAAEAIGAALLTGGLVDPTLIGELQANGYGRSLSLDDAPPPLPLRDALAAAPARRRAHPDPAARWRGLEVDLRGRTVTRPPGLLLDSGGIGKGLFGDLLARRFAIHEAFAIDAAGDIRLGGHGRQPRAVQIGGTDPGEVLHTFALRHGAVATSSIARRAWRARDGRPAHHLIDPATGAPAFTGLVQVSALAPTGVEAEARAKAALLSGPERAARWLPHGGVILDDAGTVRVLRPSPALTGAAPQIDLHDLRGARGARTLAAA